MKLLLCLAEHPGEVVSIDDLLNEVWSGVVVSQDSVYQAVASLRRLLGDDPKQPIYIETVPRLGYRMVAAVSPWTDEPSAQPLAQPDSPRTADGTLPATGVVPVLDIASASSQRLKTGFALAGVLTICLALVVVFLVHSKASNNHQSTAAVVAPQPQKSVAVLPFLDLTEGMKEETFADGMTEELIDKLSKVPELRVPAPTSSFYYKDKQMPIADIAKALSVAYVLDGSVRKSGTSIRVSARLVRADNGYIIWSETYDRPFHDLLMVQDDIAGEVTKALKASIEARPLP
jgi:transcriptional activator of cad operon